jgi:hypothetical protein
VLPLLEAEVLVSSRVVVVQSHEHLAVQPPVITIPSIW